MVRVLSVDLQKLSQQKALLETDNLSLYIKIVASLSPPKNSSKQPHDL